MSLSVRAVLRSGLWVVLPTVLVCLGMLELGLRMMGRLPSNTTDGIFELHGSSYRLKANQTKLSRTPSFTCTIHTNAYGLRDRAPGPRRLGPEPYFAFLGDSLTFGNGVDYDDSFVGVFAGLARARGRDAVNLAVGGHRLSDQEERLEEFLAVAPQKPSHVVVMFTPPLVAMFELRYLDLVVKNGYLFSRSDWIVPYVTVMLGNASSAYSLFRDDIRHLQSRLFPSHRVRTALELVQIFARDAPAATPAVAERLEAKLASLDGQIRRAGAVPVYVYLPSSADLRMDEIVRSLGHEADQYDFSLYLRLLKRHCERAGIRLVDLQPGLRREQARGKPLSFVHDMHYDRDTNRVIGLALYDALLGSTEAQLSTTR